MHLTFLNPQGNFDPADSHWTAHPDFGGQLVYVKQVALAMGAAGHRVDIVTRLVDDPRFPEFGSLEDGYPGASNVRIVRIPAGPDNRFLAKEELWPHLVRDWVPAVKAYFEAAGGQPDVHTAHYGDGGLAGVLLRQRTGVPYTFTAHSLGAQKLDQLAGSASFDELNARYRFGRRIAAERLSMSHSLVNITSTHQERFSQYGHRLYAGAVDVHDAERFAVVPPGVDVSIFSPDPEPLDPEVERHVEDRLRRDLATDRLDLPVVVASSRLEAKKNHRVLVEAFAVDPALREAANLVIVTGAIDDPWRDDSTAGPAERAVLAELRTIIDGSGLAGSVAMFGLLGQRRLAAAYRHLAHRRAVFALTARYEPFGLAPLEAAATGLPVVVTRNGGPSESLREDGREFGVLVDPEDPTDVAAGLLRLVADREQWRIMAAAGRRRVLDRYTWEQTAGGYLAAIRAAPTAARPALAVDDYFRTPSGENDRQLTEALTGAYQR